jgi:CheY-like chemotaxis protein
LTGFELLQAVRATASTNRPHPPTPVIIVSGTAFQDLHIPIASLNVPFLPKPVSLPALLQTVREFLASSG